MKPRLKPRRDFRLAVCLLAASGLAALGHQVLWTRRLMDLLGASAESNTRVFVCFFLGLALGAAIMAGVMPGVRRPWRCLGWIELGIGLTSVPILLLPDWSGWVWQGLGPQSLLSGLGSAVKTCLSLALLLPPTVLMGMTLPVAAAAVCPTGVSQARDAVWLYAVNTLGGGAGLAFVAGFAIWQLGVPGSMLVLAGVNFLVAAGSFARSRQEDEPGQTAVTSRTGQAASPSPSRWLPAILATASGGGVMAFEVLALQLFDLSAPLSFFPPAAVLFCVILVLAVAASLVPKVVPRWGDASRLAPTVLALTGVCMVLVPVGFLSLGGARTADLVYSRTFTAFLGKLAGLSLVTLGPALLLAGTIFPLAISHGLERAASAGRSLGVLLMLNAAGAVAAAEFVRGILLPRFGVHVAIGILAIGYAMLAIVLQVSLNPRHVARFAVPILGLCGTTVVTVAWLPRLPLFYWGDAYQALEVRSGREGVLTVFEGAEIGRGMSFNNQYLLGGSGVAADEQRQSHLPLLLHPAPGSVAFAGLGTGITASGALRHSAVKSITVIELSTLVADAAAKHFRDFNGRLLDQTNVILAVEDARTYLAACHERFDAVIGDLFTPWRPGEAGLASREYFRAARGALRSGGVFCQWLPLHQLTADQFVMILETFHTVFPQAYLFRNHCKTSNIPLALIGFKDAVLDWAVVRARCDGERAAGRLADPLCRHTEGVAMLSRPDRQARIVQGAEEEVGEVQASSPVTKIGAVEGLGLHLEHAEHVAPLAVGNLAAFAVPLEFGQDGVFVTSPSVGIIGGASVRPVRQFWSEPRVGETTTQPRRRLARRTLAESSQHELLQRARRVQDEGELPRRRRPPPQLDQHPFRFRAGILSRGSHRRSIIPAPWVWEVPFTGAAAGGRRTKFGHRRETARITGNGYLES